MAKPAGVAGAQPLRGEREGSPLAQILLIQGGAARERCAALRLISWEAIEEGLAIFDGALR
jgi:hypothetical protein